MVAACGSSGSDDGAANTPSLAELGEELFHDPILSKNQTQACATCHDPERAFVDPRLDETGRIAAVSLGDDGVSLGDRNAPTAAYAAFTPEFQLDGTRRRFNKQNNHRTYEGPLGGMFLDGREPDLAGQAGGPPLNPLEMGMPDQLSVVTRLQEDPRYAAAFRAQFGADVFDDPAVAYRSMTEAIAAFERTDVFAPFDSKYDRWLRAEADFSFKEITGQSLFFSEFTNCGICHQLHSNGDPVNMRRETFSGYEYHNIGVPVNSDVRAANGVTTPDPGLASNPAVASNDRAAARGKFKVPTLRNVAVTEPYMHNGIFRDLRTTVEFYMHFINPDDHPTNPETGERWRDPEVPETVATDLLRVGDPDLTDYEIESLVCFMRTLTDQRYEPLIEDKGIDCD
jgi:cytochrome c peroxidase